MKKLFSIVLALILIAGGLAGYEERSFVKRFQSFELEAKASTGAIFVGNRFHCSGTEIGRTNDGGGIFLTARHCVADPDTNQINENLSVSFSDNEGGPYYIAAPIAVSLTDDLALLYLKNGADIPVVNIKDERWLRSGNPIFNVSFPMGAGKTTFHGEYLMPIFPHFPDILAQYSMWTNAMPINLTIAHGSSGSGIFSKKEHALIGVAVGTFEEGSYNIAVPADRVLDFLNDLPDNTVDKFIKAFPIQDAPDFII
jgi:S1-C subfamily serine protease